MSSWPKPSNVTRVVVSSFCRLYQFIQTRNLRGVVGYAVAAFTWVQQTSTPTKTARSTWLSPIRTP